MQIEGRDVVVTGASSGIGRAAAEAMAAAGGRVLLLARTGPDLEALADAIEDAGGAAEPFPVDLSDRSAVAETAATIRESVGDPHVLVNNAGIGSWVSVPETGAGQAEAMMAVPYFAAFNLTREFLPAMLERDAGHVVNVSSPAPWATIAGATAYNASRYAQHGFTEALWLDLHATGVGVTEVVPYHVDGTGYADRNENVIERTPGTGRLVRHVDVETVADAIVDGVRNERRRVVLPVELRLVLLFARLFPGLVYRLNVATGWQPADDAGERAEPEGPGS